MADQQRQHWLDEPRNVRLLWRLCIMVLILSVAAGLVVPLDPHFAIDAVFGFHAWFGFLACVVMIGIAKGIGLLLKRPERYYDGADD